MEKPIKVAAKAIIFANDQVLVLKRSLGERKKHDHHGWDFPGGSLEPTETVMNALAREVKEETALEVKVVAPAYVYDEVQENNHLIVIKFACGEPRGDIQLSHEHESFAWINLHRLEETELPEWMKDEIRRAFRAYMLYRE